MTGTALTPLSPKEQAQLVNYNAASQALERAVKIDDVKNIRNTGVAWRAYAAQAKDTKLREWADELKLRAERKAGEMLIAMRESGELASKGFVKGSTRLGGQGTGRKGSLIVGPTGIQRKTSDLGISREQSVEWGRLAKLSEEQFEKVVADAKAPREPKAKPDPVTVEDDSDDGDTPDNSLLAVRKWAELAANYAPEALKEVRTHDYTDRAAVREVTQIINDLLKTWTKVHKIIGERK